VCRHDRDPIRDGFNICQADDSQKLGCNVLFVEAAAKMFGGKDKLRALILDCGNTAAALRAKFTEERIRVVIPNAQPESFEALVMNPQPGVVPVQERFGTHLRDSLYGTNRPGYDIVWHDGCATLHGCVSTGTFPLEDLRRTFEYGLGRDGRPKLVGATFALRNSLVRGSGTKVTNWKILEELTVMANHYGWKVEDTNFHQYTNLNSRMLLVIMGLRGKPAAQVFKKPTVQGAPLSDAEMLASQMRHRVKFSDRKAANKFLKDAVKKGAWVAYRFPDQEMWYRGRIVFVEKNARSRKKDRIIAKVHYEDGQRCSHTLCFSHTWCASENAATYLCATKPNQIKDTMWCILNA
jgi:hypothetical protein